MSIDKRWGKIPWPWDFEILILLTILGTLWYTANSETLAIQAQYEGMEPTEASWNRASWILSIAFAYLAHISIGRLSPKLVSTPIGLILAPTAFALLSYFHLLASYQRTYNANQIITGQAWEPLLLAVVVLAASVMLARVRMQRVAIRLRRTEWDLNLVPEVDSKSFLALALRLQPLFYMPRRYKACPEGILIEGWSYVLPLSFSEIASVNVRKQGDSFTPGFYLVRAMSHLVQLHLKDVKEPVFISPEKPEMFVDYCKTRIQENAARSRREKHAERQSRIKARQTSAGDQPREIPAEA